MTLNVFFEFVTDKFALHRYLVYIQRINSKDIAMHQGIIPGWARAIIAKIITAHIAVMGKKVGVVVQALAGIIQSQRTGLAARGDAVGIRPLGNLPGISG